LKVSIIFDVNAQDWTREILRSDRLTAVYFWHQQCPWCLRFTPMLETISTEYFDKIKFFKLNILADSNNQELATNYGVMSTPAIMFFCDGRTIGQIVGLMSEEQLKKTFDNMLEVYRQCVRQSTDLKRYIV